MRGAIAKKNGLFSKVMGKAADDFDQYLALEQMAEKRKELESICRLYAPIGTWDRFIEYEAKMRKDHKREAEERQRQIEQSYFLHAEILSRVFVFQDFW